MHKGLKAGIIAAMTVCSIGAFSAEARRGADDPAGHVRNGRGADDAADHVRQGRGADDSTTEMRQNRGRDDAAGDDRGRGRGRGRGADDVGGVDDNGVDPEPHD